MQSREKALNYELRLCSAMIILVVVENTTENLFIVCEVDGYCCTILYWVVVEGSGVGECVGGV